VIGRAYERAPHVSGDYSDFDISIVLQFQIHLPSASVLSELARTRSLRKEKEDVDGKAGEDRRETGLI